MKTDPTPNGQKKQSKGSYRTSIPTFCAYPFIENCSFEVSGNTALTRAAIKLVFPLPSAIKLSLTLEGNFWARWNSKFEPAA